MTDTADEGAAPLSAAELAAIAERAARATPGPWEAERANYGPVVHVGLGVFDCYVEGAVWDCTDSDDGCATTQDTWMADAAFIAAARTDIPRLLATITACDAIMAAYREIMAAVAAAHATSTRSLGLNVDDTAAEADDIDYAWHLVDRARALLAGEAGDTTAAGEEGE